MAIAAEAGASTLNFDAPEECFGWINSHLDEASRKPVHAWSWVKVRKGIKIAAFATGNGMNDRLLRRQIQHCRQVIANNLNCIVLVEQ
ncbi:UNVERIFIED_ORG: hypothetical protein GGD51_002487 [Rhizobium esperanzae]|uniref:hypothetical protein n=1 Tax=Rhizobium phaseoli TaxID=396 RepID=UPI001143B026|nr:hypothetical protein [Rhizobium phaseoli]